MCSYQKLKLAINKYGKAAFVVYFGLGTITLSACYIAISEGVDVASLMQSIGITSGPWLNPTSGTFVVAYAVHKVEQQFALVRYFDTERRSWLRYAWLSHSR